MKIKKILIIIVAIVIGILVLAGIFGEKKEDKDKDTSSSISLSEKSMETEAEEKTPKVEESEKEKPTEEEKEKVSKEFSNALKKAELYSDTMHMSKAGIFDQLTSEYGEGFSEDAANYAVENLKADYKNNALEKAKT